MKKKQQKKQKKVIFFLKEDRQDHGLFVKKYPEKHEAFKYTLTTFPLTTSTSEGKLCQPKANYHFRNYFIELSNAKVSEIDSNLIVIFDVMTNVRSVPP